ncbi:flavoredoxin [Clostridium sp. M62/1]|nr:flavoredoxin [Clostridium sp. M62/1]
MQEENIMSARKNFGAKPFLFPQPVLIIGTYDENGKANAMNAAWGGIVGADEIMIDLSHHKTTENLMKTKAFTVSAADAEHVVACDYVGIVSGSTEPNKMEKAGFTTTKSEFVNAPIINELPVTLECELVDVIGGSKYLGRIKNVSVDERVLGEDGEISLDLFFPITYDTVHHGYYRLGERVGNAFQDGGKLK